jgi:hypothetical protein
MRKSVEAATQMGLFATSHGWDRKEFIDRMTTMLKLLKADESLQPRARFGVKDGRIVLWHYLAGAQDGKAATEGDNGEFDISFPCPPNFPPSGPPCP